MNISKLANSCFLFFFSRATEEKTVYINGKIFPFSTSRSGEQDEIGLFRKQQHFPALFFFLFCFFKPTNAASYAPVPHCTTFINDMWLWPSSNDRKILKKVHNRRLEMAGWACLPSKYLQKHVCFKTAASQNKKKDISSNPHVSACGFMSLNLVRGAIIFFPILH